MLLFLSYQLKVLDALIKLTSLKKTQKTSWENHINYHLGLIQELIWKLVLGPLTKHTKILANN